ncbi:MAG: helix-turn-helix domain-containing protein [Acidaminococcaceae bacterium]|nr:helix-turn-helix domain-containing protein [Acidaminococcaceae bacterium]
MAVSYNKLWKLMIDKKLSKTELTHIAGISTNAMAKLGRDEDVRVNILEKICIALDCNVEDIVEFIAEPTMEEK